ncbi:hypothetical protein BD779DRAFT_1479841 [Infundibulicybe gibba]|nr:hypothetical protein BD779DRAFT_1479841 [Infundibulicybe gibba]
MRSKHTESSTKTTQTRATRRAEIDRQYYLRNQASIRAKASARYHARKNGLVASKKIASTSPGPRSAPEMTGDRLDLADGGCPVAWSSEHEPTETQTSSNPIATLDQSSEHEPTESDREEPPQAVTSVSPLNSEPATPVISHEVNEPQGDSSDSDYDQSNTTFEPENSPGPILSFVRRGQFRLTTLTGRMEQLVDETRLWLSRWGGVYNWATTVRDTSGPRRRRAIRHQMTQHVGLGYQIVHELRKAIYTKLPTSESEFRMNWGLSLSCLEEVTRGIEILRVLEIEEEAREMREIQVCPS